MAISKGFTTKNEWFHELFVYDTGNEQCYDVSEWCELYEGKFLTREAWISARFISEVVELKVELGIGADGPASRHRRFGLMTHRLLMITTLEDINFAKKLSTVEIFIRWRRPYVPPGGMMRRAVMVRWDEAFRDRLNLFHDTLLHKIGEVERGGNKDAVHMTETWVSGDKRVDASLSMFCAFGVPNHRDMMMAAVDAALSSDERLKHTLIGRGATDIRGGLVAAMAILGLHTVSGVETLERIERRCEGKKRWQLAVYFFNRDTPERRLSGANVRYWSAVALEEMRERERRGIGTVEDFVAYP
jgi:hypothetical protein